MLTQLLYVSVADLAPDAPSLEQEMTKILSKSYVRNSQEGLTGLLLYSGGYYCQLIEGPEVAVDRAMARIEADGRHKQMNVLFRRPSDWVFLPGHPMGCAGIEREVDELIADAVNLRGWTSISEAAPVVLYALLSRVPETDLVLDDPGRLLSGELQL